MAVVDLTATPGSGPKLANFIVGRVNETSKFMAASKRLDLDAYGTVIPSVTEGGDAQWIAEGAKKPVVQPVFDSLSITGKKLAKIVYVTTEFAANHKKVLAKIEADAIGSLARTFDRTVAGLVTAPTGFTSLGGSTVRNISNWETFIAAITPQGVNANDRIILNTTMKFQLMALPNHTNTGPLLQITDNSINGIPYLEADFRTTDALAFIGPFSTDAFWGVIPGSVSVKRSTEATIDDNGTLVHLFQENKVAFLVEGYFGFRTSDDFENADTQLFSKLTAGAVVAS